MVTRKPDPLPDICTRIEAAKYLRVSLPVFDALIRNDVDPIPTLRIGKRFIFVRTELVAWARRQADRKGYNASGIRAKARKSRGKRRKNDGRRAGT